VLLTDRFRLRSQYIWEEARFNTPKKHTNIVWLRLEKRIAMLQAGEHPRGLGTLLPYPQQTGEMLDDTIRGPIAA
jgi:hypothetical protein